MNDDPPRALAADRGSVLPLTAIVVGAVVLAMTLVVVTGDVRVRSARAQWAADAAALAAAAEVVAGPTDGGAAARRAARTLAEANGARLISIEIRPSGSGAQPGPAVERGIPVVGRAGAANEGVAISPTVVVEVQLGRLRARAGAARFALAERS